MDKVRDGKGRYSKNDSKVLEERLIKKITVLERELVDAKIKMHKEGYIHVPFSWGGCGRVLLCLGSFLLLVLNVWSVVFFWGFFNIGNLFAFSDVMDKSLVSTSQLFFLFPLFFCWFCVWLFVFCLKAWHDGGWDDLGGLVVGLVGGWVGSLVGGLVVGLVFGLVFGLIVGLSES